MDQYYRNVTIWPRSQVHRRIAWSSHQPLGAHWRLAHLVFCLRGLRQITTFLYSAFRPSFTFPAPSDTSTNMENSLGGQASPTIHFVQQGGSHLQVYDFAISIAAVVDRRDGGAIELVQHTPKRNKDLQDKLARITSHHVLHRWLECTAGEQWTWHIHPDGCVCLTSATRCDPVLILDYVYAIEVIIS
jgi:hypothetical protein